MKDFSKKIASILMALVVIFSTMSFTVSQHYCGGELVSSALFSKAKSCGMEMQKPATPKDCNIQKENCCKDIIKQIEGEKVVKTEAQQLQNYQQIMVASFVYTYVNLFEGLDKNIIPFKNYTPPLLVTNIQVVDQVFII